MIGRELQGDYYRSDFQASSQPEVALDVRNLVYEDRLKGFHFRCIKEKSLESVDWHIAECILLERFVLEH